ncbi:MAG: portal protein [Rubrobacteraceae bacterium]|jgi:putative flavoprotein involved in K+ transport|nr:portal protein [Rubrobacteraceae bacterium]
MTNNDSVQRFDTIVVGGGQAGLAVGYYLAEQPRNFVILDAADRVGDTWRGRWDSLRLFTPARYDGLPGMPFPAPGGYYPTKDEMADYLEAYADRFGLPVRNGVRVESLTKEEGRYLLVSNARRFEAENVVVATGFLRRPKVLPFAANLSPSIVQLHSGAYQNPDQLPAGNVLVVGAGNSGAEISVELAGAGRRVWLSGRDVGRIPFGLGNPFTWWVLGKVLTSDSRFGRKLKEGDKGGGTPLIRLTPHDILRAGVKRVPKTDGVAGGKPRLEDGRILDADVVVWATGFGPDFDWIELPIFGKVGYPLHHRGVAERAAGLYFLALPFQHTLTSALIGGVGADARYVAEHLRSRDGSGAQRRRSTGSNQVSGGIRSPSEPGPPRDR